MHDHFPINLFSFLIYRRIGARQIGNEQQKTKTMYSSPLKYGEKHCLNGLR